MLIIFISLNVAQFKSYIRTDSDFHRSIIIIQMKHHHNKNCYKCKMPGHMAANCPHFPDNCYNCNQSGHMSKDCPKNKQQQQCYNCGGPGHFAKDCPKVTKQLTDIEKQMLADKSSAPAPAPAPGPVYIPAPAYVPAPVLVPAANHNACYNCGQVGHKAFNCPNKGQNVKCFRCGKFGHIAVQCPK